MGDGSTAELRLCAPLFFCCPHHLYFSFLVFIGITEVRSGVEAMDLSGKARRLNFLKALKSMVEDCSPFELTVP